MKENNRFKPLIGVLCIALVLLAAAVAVMLDSRSPDPILGIFQTEPVSTDGTTAPTESTEGTTESTEGTETPTDPSEELPPEDTGASFPYQIPEYGLVIEKMAPYSGLFVEDGSNASIENVAMLMVYNGGSTPVEYTQIRVMCGQQALTFDISALPVGERLVVQEKTGKTITDSKADSVSVLVVERADMEMSAGKVKVVDNGDNTLTVQNLTDEMIPTVRVFYKYYMEAEDLFVGGIAFTVRITRLGAGASVSVRPSHYTSNTSCVVMVLTYDSEV